VLCQGSGNHGSNCGLSGIQGHFELRPPFGRCGSPGNLGVALSDSLRERFRAVNHASPSEYRRGHEAGAPAAYVDDTRVRDPEAGFLECGVEL
jgi:hypothetical protein